MYPLSRRGPSAMARGPARTGRRRRLLIVCMFLAVIFIPMAHAPAPKHSSTNFILCPSVTHITFNELSLAWVWV